MNDQVEEEPIHQVQAKSTVAQAYFNFLKSLLGIGVIALPYVTYQVGWLWSIVLFWPITLSCLRSNRLLIEVADDLRVDGLLYADVARVCLGWIWPQVIDWVIIISQVGVCIAYLIFLTQGLQNSLYSAGLSLDKIHVYILSLLIIVPLSLIKKIHFFHQTSKLGFYLAVFGLIIVAVDCVFLIMDGNYSFSKPIDYRKSFQYVGVAVILCEGAPTILPIRDSMVNKFDFIKVAHFSILSNFVISAISALLSTITYQDKLEHIVIFNINNHLLQILATLLYSISIMLTYPLQLFPSIQIIEQIFKERRYSEILSEEDLYEEEGQVFATEQKSVTIRMSIMVAIYLVAYWVPSLSHFLNLLGSVLGSTLQFLFPVLIHIVHFSRTNKKQPKFTYSIILFIAFFVMTLGTYQSILGLS